jgi:hypothetical protein
MPSVKELIGMDRDFSSLYRLRIRCFWDVYRKNSILEAGIHLGGVQSFVKRDASIE